MNRGRVPDLPKDASHGEAGRHAPGSSTYQSVKYFTPYDSLEACLASGGRLPGQR